MKDVEVNAWEGKIQLVVHGNYSAGKSLTAEEAELVAARLIEKAKQLKERE